MDLFWHNLFSAKKRRRVFDVLRKSFLFAGLSNDQLKKIEDLGHIRRFKGEEIIFYKGEPSYGLYIVLEGEVRIKIKDLEVQVYTKGDFFGEFSLIKEDSVRTATALSIGNSTLFYISSTSLKDLFKYYPKIGLSVYERLVEVFGSIIIEYNIEIIKSKNERLKHR